MQPIKALTQGAQRIAAGDFEHSIVAETGDEMQTLAQQFNTMARDLKELYTDLEQKVEARTDTLLQPTRDLAVLEERNRMAREIHDTLAQGFTGIFLQLEAAEQAWDESPPEVTDHLGRAKNLAKESLQEARRSVWNLVPRALEQLPVSDALRDEVEQFNSAHPEKAHFSVSGEKRELPSDVQTVLLRISQESLMNIRKHAKATEVNVNLAFEPDAVHLRIKDNGVGFDVETKDNKDNKGSQGGFGLTAMEQRARLLRGSFRVTSETEVSTKSV